jgi:DNA-binding transcriptional LysR family regulator
MRHCGKQDNESPRAERSRSGRRHCAQELVPRRGTRPGHVDHALSNAIRKLEASLGVRLFNRTTRSVSLTDAGRVFVEQVGPALQDIHSAMEAVRSQQATPSGTLRINAFATAAREILSPLVLEFLRRHPQVHVDLVTEGRLIDIVAEGFDLGSADGRSCAQRHDRGFARAATAIRRRRARRRISRAWKAARPPDLVHHQCIRVRLPNGALLSLAFRETRTDGAD